MCKTILKTNDLGHRLMDGSFILQSKYRGGIDSEYWEIVEVE